MALRRENHPGDSLTVTLPTLILLLALCTVTSAVEFAGGTGDPNNPYQIATANQLIAIGSDPNLLTKHFVLISDIDLDPNLPGGMVFTHAVIGWDVERPFTGCLDGMGHVISNLVINTLVHYSVGLFGCIEGGQLKNLDLDNARVTGRYDAGGLAGAISHGTISCCRVTANVVGSHVVGGLVGTNDFGTVSFCRSAGSVTGGDFTGGLVGASYGSVTDSCYSSCNVMGKDYVGGLVGGDWGIATLSSCSTGDVKGGGVVGGLVGTFQGVVFTCRSTGSVTGTGWLLGGLAGLSSEGIIVSSYSTGAVTGPTDAGSMSGARYGRIIAGPNDVGGLLGGGYSAGIRASYFLMSEDSNRPNNKRGTALTAAQMSKQASFEGWDFWATDVDGTRDEWFLPKDSLPVLVWETESTGLSMIPQVAGLSVQQTRVSLESAGFVMGNLIYDYDSTISEGCVLRASPFSFAVSGSTIDVVVSRGRYDWNTNPGDGSIAKPYQIGTASQLESLSDHPELWSKHFILTADIDLTRRAYPAALIAPVASQTSFSGTFNGQGHTIANLTILTHSGDYLGLFGKIASTGVVSHLNLSNAHIMGGQSSEFVGALTGSNDGTIIDCSATGILIGDRWIGGLSGKDSGTSENCTTDLLVTWLWRS